MWISLDLIKMLSYTSMRVTSRAVGQEVGFGNHPQLPHVASSLQGRPGQSRWVIGSVTGQPPIMLVLKLPAT